MKLLLHDFAGHPFPAHLARALARRGIEVDHAFCAGVASGRGDLARRAGDPGSLRFTALSEQPFERYAPLRRLASELRYGSRLARHVVRSRPDAVLSGNTPLLAQMLLWAAAGHVGARRAYWVQDFLGRGTRDVLSARSRLLGATLGAALEGLETRLLRRSDAAVVISDDFVSELERRSVDVPVTVIENWAPLDEIPVEPKDNAWARSHGLQQRPVALYSGTLGLKHDPDHLLAVARALRGTDAALVVVTEGRGRQHLEAARAREDLEGTLVLLDYVDYETFPQLLGAADVCLVLLEAGAGTFSVPSKVLAYLAAGRPIAAAVPGANLAARIIERAGAGTVTEPGDHQAFVDSVATLLQDGERRAAGGRSARAYAEATFDIEVISARVAEVLAAGPPAPLSELEAPHGTI
ncbi:MAG TPA: glycosyltransferase family 4 protein [Acidimicrobiales bacterium]|nr:glycosyltransferase family 4 protein [Acidimicrobiales bacterium]